MKNILRALICGVATLMVAGHASAASAPQSLGKLVPTSVVDPRVVAKAKEWFHRFQTGDIDRSQLSAQVNAQLSDTMIRQEATILKPLGDATSFSFIRTYPISGVVGYDFLLQFKAARIVEMIAFNAEGKIAGIDFQKFIRAAK